MTHEEGRDNVRQNAKEQQLAFPILVDDDKSNWNSWGNSMWPAVYLIDKQGYARFWWYGELNWQNAGAQEILKRRIEELLQEEG